MSSASLTSTEAVRHGNYRGPNRDGAATANATVPLCEGRKTANSQLKMVIQQFPGFYCHSGGKETARGLFFQPRGTKRTIFAWRGSVRNIAGASECNTVAHEAKKYEGKREKWESPNNLICPWVSSSSGIVLSALDKWRAAVVSEQKKGRRREGCWGGGINDKSLYLPQWRTEVV